MVVIESMVVKEAGSAGSGEAREVKGSASLYSTKQLEAINNTLLLLLPEYISAII